MRDPRAPTPRPIPAADLADMTPAERRRALLKDPAVRLVASKIVRRRGPSGRQRERVDLIRHRVGRRDSWALVTWTRGDYLVEEIITRGEALALFQHAARWPEWYELPAVLARD